MGKSLTPATETPPNLHLTLKAKWFDQMVAGKKDEEYREIKEYWTRRLMTEDETAPFKAFGWVYFKNGYQKNAPTMMRKWLGTEIRPIAETGAPFEGSAPAVFVIKVGPVEDLQNYHGPQRYGRPPTIRKSRNVQKPAPAAKPALKGSE
jgi:hypothetical protein